MAVVLEARVDDGQVGEAELIGGGCDPVQAASLRVDEREGRRSVGDRQRQTGQTGARSQVCPTLSRLRVPDRREAEGVVEMALPEPSQLSRPQEPEADRRCIGPLQGLGVACAYPRMPFGGVAVGQCFT
jgi:hypothetical protein